LTPTELTDHADRRSDREDDKPFLSGSRARWETVAHVTRDKRIRWLGADRQGRARFAVVDLRLGDGNWPRRGVGAKAQAPGRPRIVLTRLRHIATASPRWKMGAVDYLSKPADADDVVAALRSRAARKNPNCRTIRCRPTGCAGTTSNAIYEMCNRTSRKPRGG